MNMRARWSTFLLMIALAFNAACGVIEPTPTPTLILPNPRPEQSELTQTPEVTATEGLETPTAQPTTPVTETPSATETPQQVGLDRSPAFETGGSDWPMAHYSYENSRANLASEQPVEGVGGFEEAWRINLPSSPGSAGVISSPVVYGGTVFVQDRNSSLFAIDLQTGQLIWEYRLELPVSRANGPGIGYGRVYIPAGEDQLHALNIETGQPEWSATLPGANGLHQPYVFGGLVLTGTSPEASAGSPLIFALNANSGELVWQYPAGAGQAGSPETPAGSAGVSQPPAIDTERGLALWGTGSPVQFPGSLQFPDDSPELDMQASSIIAIDLATGQLAWFGDQSAGELFGQDARLSPLLLQANLDGQPRDLVVGAGRFGSLAALDRDTGAPVWRVTLGESASGVLVTQAGGAQEGQPTSGSLSGVHGPLAFSEGVLYAAITRLPAGMPLVADDSGEIDLSQAASELVAIDVNTAQVLWTRSFDGALTGGATVDSNLVYTLTHKGAIFVLDRRTGAVLWHAITAPDPHFLPVVAGGLVLLPVSGANMDFISLVALRPSARRSPTISGTLTPTPTQQESGSLPTATLALPGQASPTPTSDLPPVNTPTPPADPFSTPTPTPTSTPTPDGG